jgi:hypothetical protein
LGIPTHAAQFLHLVDAPVPSCPKWLPPKAIPPSLPTVKPAATWACVPSHLPARVLTAAAFEDVDGAWALFLECLEYHFTALMSVPVSLVGRDGVVEEGKPSATVLLGGDAVDACYRADCLLQALIRSGPSGSVTLLGPTWSPCTSPDDFCPIVLLSVFYRLWAKSRGPVFQAFHRSGGVAPPGKTTSAEHLAFDLALLITVGQAGVCAVSGLELLHRVSLRLGIPDSFAKPMLAAYAQPRAFMLEGSITLERRPHAGLAPR